jgi:hypothetical protein
MGDIDNLFQLDEAAGMELDESGRDPEPPTSDRFARMSAKEIARLAREAKAGGFANDELPGPWGAVDDLTFSKVLDEAKQPPELIDWDETLDDETDPTGARRYARRHIEVREAGLDGAVAQFVLAGDATLEEGIAMADAEQAAAVLNDAQPDGLAESLDEDELEKLIQAGKQGFGDSEAKRLARKKGLVE